MNRRLRFLLPVCLLLLAACAPQARKVEGPVSEAVQSALDSGRESFDHAAWGALLANGTSDGLVDYRYLQQHRVELDAYLADVADVELSSLAGPELKALLANAYNAFTVRAILDHPDVSTIRDIPGVWKTVRHTVGGYELTLDEIEHQILRPFFRDPRIHFAVNCASRSCAPLPPWAFDGADLDRQLDELQAAFLADPNNMRVEHDTLRLSQYFDWYGSDFTAEGWRQSAASVAAYLRPLASAEVAAFIDQHDGAPPVSYQEYDWSLNAAVPPDPDVASPSRPAVSDGWVSRLRDWVQGFGPLGPLVYGLAYVLATVAFVPGSALTIGAGVTFGVVGGTILVSIAATTGAAVCFLLARYLLRSRVERWVAGNEKFTAIDSAVAREGWKIVALTRLSPIFPFNLLNYSYGLTGIGFWPYVLASWVAMIPGSLLYVYIGAAGAQVAESASGAGSWGQTALQVAGLLATLAVTILVTRIARRALKEAQDPEAGKVASP